MAATSPEDVDRLFQEYLNAGDMEGLLSLYEEPGVLLLEGTPVQGRTAIRDAIKGLLSARPEIRMKVTQVLRANDVAVLYNDWSLSARGPDGSLVEQQGRAIEVVRRQPDGSWLFVIDDPQGRQAT